MIVKGSQILPVRHQVQTRSVIRRVPGDVHALLNSDVVLVRPQCRMLSAVCVPYAVCRRFPVYFRILMACKTSATCKSMTSTLITSLTKVINLGTRPWALRKLGEISVTSELTKTADFYASNVVNSFRKYDQKTVAELTWPAGGVLSPYSNFACSHAAERHPAGNTISFYQRRFHCTSIAKAGLNLQSERRIPQLGNVQFVAKRGLSTKSKVDKKWASDTNLHRLPKNPHNPALSRSASLSDLQQLRKVKGWTMNNFMSKASFYPTLAWNMAVEKLTGRPWYHRIDQAVILGALPFRSMLQQLKDKEHVVAFLSLNEEYELSPRFYPTENELTALGIEFKNLPVSDFVGMPTVEQLTEAVEYIERKKAETGGKGTVYVHCKAGRYRSATIVLCYMIKTYHVTPEQAVEMVRNKRSHVVVFKRQLRFMNDYYETVGENSAREQAASTSDATDGRKLIAAENPAVAIAQAAADESVVKQFSQKVKGQNENSTSFADDNARNAALPKNKSQSSPTKANEARTASSSSAEPTSYSTTTVRKIHTSVRPLANYDHLFRSHRKAQTALTKGPSRLPARM